MLKYLPGNAGKTKYIYSYYNSVSLSDFEQVLLFLDDSNTIISENYGKLIPHYSPNNSTEVVAFSNNVTSEYITYDSLKEKLGIK